MDIIQSLLTPSYNEPYLQISGITVIVKKGKYIKIIIGSIIIFSLKYHFRAPFLISTQCGFHLLNPFSQVLIPMSPKKIVCRGNLKTWGELFFTLLMN